MRIIYSFSYIVFLCVTFLFIVVSALGNGGVAIEPILIVVVVLVINRCTSCSSFIIKVLSIVLVLMVILTYWSTVKIYWESMPIASYMVIIFHGPYLILLVYDKFFNNSN